MNIEKIQKALRDRNIDGWLFYDFQNRDHIAHRILGLDFSKLASRRWYYFVPAKGDPVKLVSVVERARLDSLPGEKRMYLSWREQQQMLKEILADVGKIAMQYSPENNIPYVSIVNAGTIEILRKFGKEIVSSADLVQEFESLIDENGYKMHVEAGEIIDKIRYKAFSLIEKRVKSKKGITEFEVAQFILKQFRTNDLEWHGIPIVGVNDHPADPHFEPSPENTYEIRKGDFLLIDLWAKKKHPDGIYYDITWCGFVGKEPPEEYKKVFDIVKNARNAAVGLVKERFENNQPVYGWEVDDAARNVIAKAGFGDKFIHRTGHSIGREVHGNGVNIDNLETRDTRRIVPGICFSIEPGIYIEGKMGVRSEVNVFVTPSGKVTVAGEIQENLVLMDV